MRIKYKVCLKLKNVKRVFGRNTFLFNENVYNISDMAKKKKVVIDNQSFETEDAHSYVKEGVYLGDDAENHVKITKTSVDKKQEKLEKAGQKIILKTAKNASLNFMAIKNAMINVINDDEFLIVEKKAYIDMLNIIKGVLVDEIKLKEDIEKDNKKIKAIRVDIVPSSTKDQLSRIEEIEKDL